MPTAWLMEAAGWQLARQCPGRVAVACGYGNNAGDGLAAARHLHRWGRLRSVACLDRGRLRDIATDEAKALEALGVEIAGELDLAGADTVLDALFGTGLSRAPEGRAAMWIETINSSGRRVVAVDVPSGLDSDRGTAYQPCVRATLTVTLGLPKSSLFTDEGRELAGEIWVADIGVPFEAYATLGLAMPPGLFAARDRFRLERTAL